MVYCAKAGTKTPMSVVVQKAFYLVDKGVQWQATFACLNMCWTYVMMVGGTNKILLPVGVFHAALICGHTKFTNCNNMKETLVKGTSFCID